MQSDTILQQEQIIQHEDIVDRDISKVPQVLDISKKRFEGSSNIVIIQIFDGANSLIYTKNENTAIKDNDDILTKSNTSMQSVASLQQETLYNTNIFLIAILGEFLMF